MDKVKRFAFYKTIIRNAFAEMGNTPEDCAKHIRKLGIKGMKFDERCCPFGNYLTVTLAKAKMPSVKLVLTNDCVLVFDNKLDEKDGFLGCVNYPPHVRRFVELMDKEEWPELLAGD